MIVTSFIYRAQSRNFFLSNTRLTRQSNYEEKKRTISNSYTKIN